MDSYNFEEYIERLLSSALKKCGNIDDAQDLVQETLLSAIIYINKGNKITNTAIFLSSVMKKKFNDHLRKKYRREIISISDFDYLSDDDSFERLEESERYEDIRKAVANLARIYREVIVRYYMNGESVSKIAFELNIPEGTVKSRLHLGRDHIKKGLSNMEKYSNQSYSPVTLNLSYSGSPGLNGEPTRLVNNDLLAQNILWFAYKKPVTVEEISMSVGVSAAYIEPIIDNLYNNELMCKVGNKYYTDFMISTIEDMERYIPEQKKFVKDNFFDIWNPINSGLNKLRESEFYKRCTFDEKNSLELYFAFNCLDHGVYMTFCEVFNTVQVFPERPNEGRWIAFGSVNFKKFNNKEHLDLLSHSYSGERIVKNDNYGNGRRFEIHVYSPDGFPAYPYYYYTLFPENANIDLELAKLLYILSKDIEPTSIGFNTEYLKMIPHLKKCMILREENGKPCVNVPVINEEEAKILWQIVYDTRFKMVAVLKPILSEFFAGKDQKLPPHLNSVPLQKKYLHADNAILFDTVREAISRGNLYDGKYDDDSNGINQPPCPMVLVIG